MTTSPGSGIQISDLIRILGMLGLGGCGTESLGTVRRSNIAGDMMDHYIRSKLGHETHHTGPVPILWCVAFLDLDNEDSGPKVASCKGLIVRQRESHNRDFSVALVFEPDDTSCALELSGT